MKFRFNEISKYSFEIISERKKTNGLRYSFFFINKNEIIDFIENYKGSLATIIDDLLEYDDYIYAKYNFDINTPLEDILDGLEGINRKIVFMSWLNRLLQKKQLQRAIIVGGSAVEFWSRGNIKSIDIDLIYYDLKEIYKILKPYGFITDSRYVINLDLDIFLEAPDSTLDGEKEPENIYINNNKSAGLIISLEDVIIDRLEQYSVGNNECLDHAIQMYIVNRDIVDKEFLWKRIIDLGISNYIKHTIIYEECRYI